MNNEKESASTASLGKWMLLFDVGPLINERRNTSEKAPTLVTKRYLNYLLNLTKIRITPFICANNTYFRIFKFDLINFKC
jgi:hypothetical protein